MKKALINPVHLVDGHPTVVSVSNVEFEAVSDYYWVNCADDVVTGMLYVNGTFVAPTLEAAPIPAPATLDENKKDAKQRLKGTDWVELPSITDTNSTPHLLNKAEFMEYRAIIRNIRLNPREGYIEWPEMPKPKWSN